MYYNYIILNPFSLKGNEGFDRIMGMLLGNPNLVGTVIACLLDNTVPGKICMYIPKRRSIVQHQWTRKCKSDNNSFCTIIV